MKLSELVIRNSNKRNCVCSITVDDKVEYFKNKVEAVEHISKLIGHVEISRIMSEQNLHTDEEINNYLLAYLTERLEVKAEANFKKSLTKNLTFYSKNITVNIKTKRTLNDVDDVLLSSLVFCKDDNNIYVVNNNSYKLLGSIANISIKEISLAAQQFLTKAMLSKLESYTGKTYDDFEEFLRDKAQLITNYAKAITAEFKLKLPPSYSSNDLKNIIVDTYDNKQIKYEDIAGYDNTNFNDVLLTYAYKTLINDVIPSGAVSCRLLKVQPTFDTVNDELTNFLRFSIERCKDERSITFVNYVAQLFDNDTVQVLEHISTINEVPYIISDDDRHAELYINKANIPTEFNGEHPRFDVFTSPYPKDELEIMLAWCYTVLHPSCNEHIMLLLQTSGGNGKTNFWRAMLIYWLKRLYGEDLTLKLTQDELKNKDKREPANSRGITTAALTVVDECKSTITDLIKTYSGSERISYTSEVKYSRAFSTLINTRFLLLSNEIFKIDDASCAFDRRVIVIKHFEIDNIYKKLPANCKQNDFAEEADYFYLQCKEAYQHLAAKYSNLCEAKEDIASIKQNEAELSNNDDYSVIYSNIYYSLLTNNKANYVQIKAAELKALFEAEAANIDVPTSSFYYFRKWLLENHFEQLNKVKNIRTDKKVDRTYTLYRLKNAVECVTPIIM